MGNLNILAALVNWRDLRSWLIRNHRHARQIPAARTNTVHRPQPPESYRYVDLAVGVHTRGQTARRLG